MEYEDDHRYGSGQDIEPDSDVDDPDSESQLSQWLGELENYAKGLEPGDTSTVRRRQKTIVTPKMAMESFRYSFLSDNQDVNLDAILGELSDLETQLGTAQAEFSPHHGHCLSPGLMKDEHRDSGNDLAQSELDALASEITRSLGFRHKRPMADLDYFHTHYPGDLGGYSDAMLDIAETDSAFSESASLPSSESFTSMVTVSSSAETAGMGDGSAGLPHSMLCDEEQKAILQAEKIRIALEKIREAKIKKLFVRAFATDGSSKSIMVDEKMTILEVIAILADKNHVRLNPDLAVVEHMPELFMERILEDHDSLVENMVMWTRDTKNKILFETRQQKNDLFKCPERYLLVSSSSEKGASLDPKRRENLIQEFFSGSAAQVPEVEGVLYLKSDGKKAWKKFFFVLRASGLYYNPKGKVSKSSKDLTCLVQFEYVELYHGLCWKKKYHAPTDFCFALKHPQIQKKTSKFIRYLCAENKAALDQWIMGIRIAKFGKQLLTNFHSLHKEIITWDTRDLRTSLSDQREACEAIAELNQEGNLSDSRLSMPEPGSRHSIVNVKNSMLIRESSVGRNSEDIVCLEIGRVDSRTPERKPSLTGITHEQFKLDKAPVKRVSFSNTHSVINDLGEEVHPVRHRDSITSASTDSSEESTSSGEGRMSNISHRSSKLRAKLPVTTGTTRQISEMVQTSMDGGSIGSFEGSMEDWKPCVSSPVQKDVCERRKSAPVCSGNEIYGERKMDGQGREHIRSASQTVTYDQLPMSPTSPLPNSPQQYQGSKVMMSPSCQKGYKSHSRGSSISSVESSDSSQGLGYNISHSSSTTHGYLDHNQSSLPLYEVIDAPHSRIHMTSQSQGQSIYSQITKQAPPTAQKPSSVKKTRPQSSPATGPVEKGHKRNTSKSSLESVEEETTKGPLAKKTGPSTVTSPLPPRSAMGAPPPPPPQSHQHPHQYSMNMSPTMSMSAPNFPNKNPHHIHIPSPPIAMQQSAPAISQVQSAQSSSPAVPSQSPIGCLSPRLSAHRSSGPKPIPPPTVPCTPPTPPPLVPPVPRNTANPVKTHKKRPSGGNIVVNGNQVMSRSEGFTYPDIVTSPRSPSVMVMDNPLGAPSSPLTLGQGQSINSSEETNYAPLPFMAELNKHMHRTPVQSAGAVPQNSDMRCPPETLPKPCDQRHKINGSVNSSQSQNEYSTLANVSNYQSHSNAKMSSSVDNAAGKHISPSAKKHVPPPPPKRSERTKLSSSQTSRTSASESCNVPNELQNIDPIYGNCDGIVDINDLPPPPPELLEDFDVESQSSQGLDSSTGKVKPPPPPPPPKRSRETQLSSSSVS